MSLNKSVQIAKLCTQSRFSPISSQSQTNGLAERASNNIPSKDESKKRFPSTLHPGAIPSSEPVLKCIWIFFLNWSCLFVSTGSVMRTSKWKLICGHKLMRNSEGDSFSLMNLDSSKFHGGWLIANNVTLWYLGARTHCCLRLKSSHQPGLPTFCTPILYKILQDSSAK